MRTQHPSLPGVEARGDQGFAMLAALVVVVIAVVFAGVAAAAALGTLRVTAGDGGSARARAAALVGTELALHRASWRLLPRDASTTCTVDAGALADGAGSSANVTLESVEPASLGWTVPGRLVRVTSRASDGTAEASVVSLAWLRPSAVPRGLSVAEDVDVQATLTVGGAGLYAGGVVRGREHVSFVADGEGDGEEPPADFAWGGLWPAAGVHAGGGIWAAGADVGALVPLPEPYVHDTVGTQVLPLVELPDAAWLASARAHALDPGEALAGGVLRLDRLPPIFPTGEPGAAEAAGRADPAAGYVVHVDARGLDGGLVVTGVRDPTWCAVSVVIEGDAVLGSPVGAEWPPPGPGEHGAGAALQGALVITGHLQVAAPSSVAGHVACRRLLVSEPLSLRLEQAWREAPPAGLLEPVLLARE